MIIRIWGRTVLNQKQPDLLAIAEELKRAFSTRPCFGIDIRGSTNVKRVRNGLEVREEPVRRLVSTTCALWSDDGYADENIQELEGALCKVCKDISSEPIMDVKTEMLDQKSMKTRDHICNICGKGFFTKQHLKSHATQKHHVTIPGSKHSSIFPTMHSSGQHECSECGMGFETILELSAHEESGQCEGGDDDSFRQDILMKVKCEIQDESDNTQHWRDGDDFQLPHMKEEQGNGEVERKKPFNFSYDPQGAYDDKERMKHLKKALKKEKLGLPCEVCAEWVPDKMALGFHMSVAHAGEQPYECTFCDKRYRSPAQMNIHRDVESD